MQQAMPAPPPRPSPAAEKAAAFATAALAPTLPPEHASREPAPVPSTCLRLRQVEVSELAEDGTLGLYMHGTSVVGFSGVAADIAGWVVGDQIVEVNGARVSAFSDFLDRFAEAQEAGFPMVFTVLRRELQEDLGEDAAQGAIESFFSGHTFMEIAGQLQNKFKTPLAPDSPSDRRQNEGKRNGGNLKLDSVLHDPVFDNPYVQALRRRRSDLMRSSAGWWRQGDADDMDDSSLASRLATQRSGALSTLVSQAWEPRSSTASGTRSMPWFFCAPEDEEACTCRAADESALPQTVRVEGESHQVSVYPMTPRVDGELLPSEWPQWVTQESSFSRFDAYGRLSPMAGGTGGASFGVGSSFFGEKGSSLDGASGSGESRESTSLLGDCGANLAVITSAFPFSEEEGQARWLPGSLPGVQVEHSDTTSALSLRLGGVRTASSSDSTQASQSHPRKYQQKGRPAKPNDHELPEWPRHANVA